MKRLLFILIALTLMFIVIPQKSFATRYYVDPYCDTPGSGTSPTCTGAGTDPKKSIRDYTITSGNEYYIKCDTVNSITNYISISGASNVTIGSYYGAGTIGVSGNRGVIDGGYYSSHSNFVVVDSPYLTIKDLEIRRGRDSIVFGDLVSSSHHFTLTNCLIGKDSQWGVRVYGGGTNLRDNWSITYNIFDNAAATNPWLNAVTGHGTSDAIQLRGVHYSDISYNEEYDYGHSAGIAFAQNTSRNRYHHNIIGRKIINDYTYDSQAIDLLYATSYNELDHNIIYGWSDGNKLMGYYNNYHHNIIYEQPGIARIKTGWAMQFGCYSVDTFSNNNAFYNNTIYKTDSLGIQMSIRSEIGYCSEDVYNYYIKNNQIIEAGNCYTGISWCETDYPEIALVFQNWFNNPPGTTGAVVRNTTIENNNIYSVGKTNVLKYNGVLKTLAQLNALNGVDGNIVSGNISVADQMVDPDNHDFTLKPTATSSIDGGAWHTTITSNTGSGTEFYVAVSPYFSRGQTIKSQSGNTGVIDSVDYENKKITMTESFSWTKDEGLSPFEYEGAKPDIGAEEYSLSIFGVTPADGSTGIAVDVNGTCDYSDSIDDVDWWLYQNDCDSVTCGDGGSVASGDDDSSKVMDFGTLNSNTTYCLGIKGNYGALQTACQEYEFTTVETANPISVLNLMDVYVGE